MIARPFWEQRIVAAWDEAPLVWLAGVRRSGKTTLVQRIDPARSMYLNCDLPAVEEMVSDPDLFYRNVTHPVVIFDEVHQLSDPSRVLKIATDQFPHLRLLATGSSTLAATRKFSDTLTGRKRTVKLLPVLWDELDGFGVSRLRKKSSHGMGYLLAAGPHHPVGGTSPTTALEGCAIVR
ncbi:MAG: AAA family ATPase [Candidatus Xenobia bacterium]